MKNYFSEILSFFSEHELDRKTVDAFCSWLADNSFREEKEAAMKEVWDATSGNTGSREIEASLASVYRRTGNMPAGLSWRRKVLKPLWYAASVVVLVGSIFSTWYIARNRFDCGMTEVCTVPGDRKIVTLPDGTVVHMNSSSLLMYPEKFTGKERIVYLVGEADFKVEKNPKQPFVVRLGGMDVTALGTEFNISSYPEDVEVTATLIEGKVRVTCGNDNGIVYILEPGEQVIYEKGNSESRVEIADIEVVSAWRDGIILFRGVTVREIAKELQRKYGVKVFVDGRADGDRYSVRFREDASIDEVLEVLSIVVEGFSFSMDSENSICHISVNQ